MPFLFSLEEVLNHRKHVEENRQKEMIEVQKQADHVERLLNQGEELRQAYRRELSAKTQEGLALASQDIYRNYLTALGNLVKKSADHLERLRAELERRRLILLQAVRERQILDELKKEERKEFLLLEAREERKAFDEIAIRQFMLKDRQNIPN